MRSGMLLAWQPIQLSGNYCNDCRLIDKHLHIQHTAQIVDPLRDNGEVSGLLFGGDSADYHH